MANSAWQKEALHQNATDRPYIKNITAKRTVPVSSICP